MLSENITEWSTIFLALVAKEDKIKELHKLNPEKAAHERHTS